MPEERLIGARRLMELLSRHNINPAKSLGQNFVIDPNSIRKVIASARLEPADRVLEIGAGAGSLTAGLAPLVAHVTAVEIDQTLLPVLEESLAGAGNVEVVPGDVLALDLGALNVNRVVANLPYNIAATVVLRVLEAGPQIADLTVMTQAEVGRRLAAIPGSKVYGQPSAMLAYWASAGVVASISRRAFFPVPNVDSVVVRIQRSYEPRAVEAGAYGSVVRAAFGQRRKTLRQSLARLAGSAGAAEALIRAAGLDPSRRAEEIDVAGFVALASAAESLGAPAISAGEGAGEGKDALGTHPPITGEEPRDSRARRQVPEEYP